MATEKFEESVRTNLRRLESDIDQLQYYHSKAFFNSTVNEAVEIIKHDIVPRLEKMMVDYQNIVNTFVAEK